VFGGKVSRSGGPRIIIGCLRVSTGGQTVENQWLAIYDAGYHQGEWFKVQASSQQSTGIRSIDELLGRLSAGAHKPVSWTYGAERLLHGYVRG
jgi:hypothetical protein